MSPGNIWDREGREGAVENKKKTIEKVTSLFRIRSK